MPGFPKPVFNIQEDHDPEAPTVYRRAFNLYESGQWNWDLGQDVEVGFVNENDFDLLIGEDGIICDALLSSMDELLSGSGPEPGGVEGIADGIRVGGISPDSDTDAVDSRTNEDREGSIFDGDFESFVEYVMEEANPIEGSGGEERERFNNGSHYMNRGGFESFEASSRFSAPERQQDPSENFSRPLIEIRLPPDFHVNDIDLSMEIDRAESSSGLSAPEGDRECRGSSRSLNDLRPYAEHEDSVSDIYFGRFVEYGMEAANPIDEFEGEEWDGSNLSASEEQQDPSENFRMPQTQVLLRLGFHVNDIDLSMEIDRVESSSSLSAAEGDQESALSLISLNEFMLSRDFPVGDMDLNIEVEGTEGDQRLLEDFPRDLRANSFDLNMEIERIVPPSPLSAIEEELEELDTLEDILISTTQMSQDASSLTLGLANGRMIPTARRVVENLPVGKMGKEDSRDGSAFVCTVCTDEIAEGEMVNILPCWHYYHGDCILPWLRVKNTCPVCRYELPIDDQQYESSSSSSRRN